MKRIFMLFLATVTIVFAALSLSSCEKHRVRLYGYQFGKTEITTGDSGSVIRFYPDGDFEYDVADFEKVKFTFKAKSIYNIEEKYKVFAYPPENARDNPELQYFELTVGQKIEEEQTLFFKARGTLYEEQSEDERTNHGAPSIFWTFVIGIVLTLVSTGFVSFGLRIWEDIPGKITVFGTHLLLLLGNIATYNLWGVGRGIIISVFCVLTLAITVFLGINLDT